VAAKLGISIARVRMLAADGVLQPVRFTSMGRLRFRVEDVEALIGGKPITNDEELADALARSLSSQWRVIVRAMHALEPGWEDALAHECSIDLRRVESGHWVGRFGFADGEGGMGLWMVEPLTGRVVEETRDAHGGISVRVLSPQGEVISGAASPRPREAVQWN
jgi:hypothetical protein